MSDERLIERLRVDADYCDDRVAATVREIGKDCRQAADRIEALIAERDGAYERSAEVAEGHRYGDHFLDCCGMRKEHRQHIANAIRALKDKTDA